MVVLAQQLAAVLLVAPSHLAILVRQGVEQFCYGLVIFELGWKMALRQQVLELILLLLVELLL